MSSLSQQSPCHITLPLSIDVLDYILSYLESDPKTLEAFCKSHPLLSQIAEPHVYANIYLRTSDHISDHNFGPSNLAKLLSDRPHIANYIRNLDIQVSGDSDEDVGTFLHEISTVLPKLLALKKISLDHQYSILKSGSQPESFHTAFVGCLRSQSVQHVCLKGISYFPFISAWHGKSRTIENLTLSNCLVLHKRGRTFNPYGSNLPIECGCGGNFLEKFSGLIKGVHFRSLEYSHYNYDLLPGLLSLSSNFLTSLDLDIGRKCMSIIYYPWEEVLIYLSYLCSQNFLWLQTHSLNPRSKQYHPNWTVHFPLSRAANHPLPTRIHFRVWSG